MDSILGYEMLPERDTEDKERERLSVELYCEEPTTAGIQGVAGRVAMSDLGTLSIRQCQRNQGSWQQLVEL